MDGVKAPPPKVFYFGFLGNGHHMYEPGGGMAVRNVQTPWGSYPDGTLCIQDKEVMEPQGKALLHHKDGWTAIGFWDRCGDTRYGSNSNFIVRGDYTFDEMMNLVEEQWHGVMFRIEALGHFQVVEAGNETQPTQEAAKGEAGS